MKQSTISQDREEMKRSLKFFLPLAACLILANIYYAQPILTDIAASIGLASTSSGMIMTMLQLGYVLGIVFLVPLGDVLENRRLVAFMVIGASAALLMAAWSDGVIGFLTASLFIGMCSVAMQVIVPFAMGLATAGERGKVLGLIIAGALLGVVLSRPASSLITSVAGWQPVYLIAAFFMLVVGVALFRVLPHTTPNAKGLSYLGILGSMVKLLGNVPLLPLRLALTGIIFLGFSMFWATAPIVLRGDLNFSHSQIALFSLASLVTPPCAIVAGKLIDRGYGNIMIFAATALIAAAYLVTAFFGMYAVAFVFAVFMLDPGMNMSTMSIQQKVLTLVPEARSRLNAINVAANFTGGAIGSALGPWMFSHFGWQAVAGVGADLMVIPFTINLVLTGFRRSALPKLADRA